MSKQIDELNRLLEFQRNPSLASLKVLASIADSFGKLSDIPIKPMHERLNTLLKNKDEAQFKELSSIAEALSLMADRGNFKGDKGDQGEQGIQGLQGEPGLDGSDGRDGSDGAHGKDGSDGVNGKDGQDGERGPAGRDGTDGADGLDGRDGVDGSDGKDGKDGSPDTPEEILEKLRTIGLAAEDIKGLEKYVDSYTLNQVIDSLWHRTQFLVNRTQQSGGGQVNSVVAGTNVTVDNTDPANPIVSSSGGGGTAPGPTGPTGATGATGPQGTQGSQGSQGSASTVPGPAGAQGTQGSQGSAGADGSQGATGPQGTQGSIGVQGATGAQGTQGSQGSIGLQGTQGSIGVQGATGAQGTQGSAGQTGPTGVMGGLSMSYIFDDVIAGAPASGQIQYNAVLPSDTTIVRVHKSDSSAQSVENILITLVPGTTIRTYWAPMVYAIFTITSVTDQTTYFDFGVSYVDSNSTFSDGDAIAFTVAYRGDKGSQGSIGAQGTQGSLGATGPQGSQGSIGAQGAQGTQGSQGSASTALGPTGPQGTQGSIGAQGTQGSQGSAGSGMRQPNVNSVVSATFFAPNALSDDVFEVTALATAANFQVTTGTPNNGQIMYIKVTDGSGASHALSWANATFGYTAGGFALPTTTIRNKRITMTFMYDTSGSVNRWLLINKGNQL